jgi:hypothetical protein
MAKNLIPAHKYLKGHSNSSAISASTPFTQGPQQSVTVNIDDILHILNSK